MKMIYFKGDHPNFGDELNPWLWPKLLPDFFNDDENNLFLGIGSIIGTRYGEAPKKTVFGTGFVPSYETKPNVHGDDWDIYFVRGPRTAAALNIDPQKSVGDSAILLRAIFENPIRTQEVISFMPHWESIPRGNWQETCKLAGINFIDPRAPVEHVMKEILRSKFVITEAMHGAIVSDAMRVPWIPLLPIHGMHRDKWFDWAEALDISLQLNRLWPSTLAEFREASIRYGAIVRTSNFIEATPLSGLANTALTHISAKRLHKLTQIEPSLSSDGKMNEVTDKMLEHLALFKKKNNIA